MESIPLDYALKNKIGFDLIGFFNTLDHLDDPLAALKRVLKLSKNIIVQIHPWKGAGPQHSFFLPDEFWNNLQNILPGVSVSEVSYEEVVGCLQIEQTERPEDKLYLIEKH